jgi:hypothetical protein
LEYVFDCSLDLLEEIVAWDPEKLDRHQLRILKEVAIAVVQVSAKVGLSRARASDELALAEVRANLKKHRAESEKG